MVAVSQVNLVSSTSVGSHLCSGLRMSAAGFLAMSAANRDSLGVSCKTVLAWPCLTGCSVPPKRHCRMR